MSCLSRGCPYSFSLAVYLWLASVFFDCFLCFFFFAVSLTPYSIHNFFKNFYNAVLVSAIQLKSAIIIHTTLPFSPSTPSLQVITEHPNGLPALHSNFSLAIHLTPDSIHIYADAAFSICPPFPPPLHPQVHSLHLHLHSFLANSFINIIFLDSVCVNTLFFWLTSLCVTCSRFVHLS